MTVTPTAPRTAFDLTGKVAIVTGSSRGIGRSIALHLADAGARVVVSSRKQPACEAVVEEIVDRGGQATAITCNISEPEQLENLAHTTLERFGRIDTLVCNAASNPYFGPMTGLDQQAFDKIMHNNVFRNLQLVNLVAPEIAKQGGGSVIVISSVGGLRGDAHIGAYNMSKAADMQLVRNLAVEWGPQKIRCNTIAPGLIKTDFARALWQNPKLLASIERGTPLGRIGQPDDIGPIAVFLAADAGAYITGQVLVADGGMTSRAAW